MTERRRVVCTGIGAVSCFGTGLEAFWNGLVERRSGQAPIQAFDPGRHRARSAAEVPREVWQDEALFARAGRPAEEATFLATIAAIEALEHAGLSKGDKSRLGCVVGTLCAASRNFEKAARDYLGTSAGRAPVSQVEAISAQYQLEHLVRHFAFEGPSSMVSTACSSSTDAIGYAADLIRSGEADVMLAGGGDILAEMVHAGFDSVFSITRGHPRPFDTERDGFFIGEGAGMLVLESWSHARERKARVWAEVLGYGLSNSAFHLTATSEDGVGEALAIERCLRDAGVAPDEVDYVNAHGTGTQHNDLSETRALRRVFGDRLASIPVTSIKPNVGHCMGASGALEAIATLQCIVHRHIPPTLNTTGNLDAGLQVVTGTGLQRPLRLALSESFGFAGASSALLIGAWDRQAPSA